jgi:chitin synthase
MLVVLVCSLGNRPRGSRTAYTLVLIYFALSFGVGLYCSGWTIYLVSLDLNLRAPILDIIKSIIRQRAFRDIVISLAATYLTFVISALLYLSPWHLITSFVQYMVR